MKPQYLAKTLLLVGLLAWAFSEFNVLNGDAEISKEVYVMDYDFGDYKVFPADHKVVVDWGNQRFIYGSGQKEIVLKRRSSWTYDLSWIPFFKDYRQKSTWAVSGLTFDRAPLELKIKSTRYGFVSRSEMIASTRQKASKELIKSFKSQTFYQIPFQNKKSNLIFSKCF